MRYEVNECCDCATESYPCIGDSCSLRHVTYYRCDRCGCDGLTEDEIHKVDGEDLCDSCFDEEFENESPCYECRGNGDDYSFDDDGELVCDCPNCPFYDCDEEDHYIDARCISGNPLALSDGTVYYQKKVRCHNRQIHKSTILKGGYRKRNQAAYEVKGFRLYDKVLWKGQKCFIFGRRTTGRMDLRLLDGTHLNTSVGYKNLKLLKMRSNYLVEQRKVG